METSTTQGSPARGRKLFTIVAVTAALVGGAGGAGIGVLAAEDPPSSSATGSLGSASGQQASNSGTNVSGVAERILPSVVQINARTASGEVIGSGVVLGADGTVLTNAHVLEGATGAVEVTLSDGTAYPADVLGEDIGADIAVLRLRGASGLTPTELGDSGQVRAGDEVVAVGSPSGLRNTVTSGIVSAINRSAPGRDSPFDRTGTEAGGGRLIQTDASINEGNSGGPLVDASGAVIGINTSILSPSGGNIGIGFAIPSNEAKEIVRQITG
ncbi:S1C family serine protease [Amycolatopsis cihanbeyliensis]|uniref:Putative serine protease PepD n=1 Tax=Amycolatopsis cihanbeyliensis TaxID=1128664 RepID=A0A542CUY4_AMYCI|nr:trypsin-like peptidase domain-containing protein [Amycolatopsis cihanbeyliensis]TQI94635.1 putative serine protease PepD [Amycolatopsis cihanbeyliensis]